MHRVVEGPVTGLGCDGRFRAQFDGAGFNGGGGTTLCMADVFLSCGFGSLMCFWKFTGAISVWNADNFSCQERSWSRCRWACLLPDR